MAKTKKSSAKTKTAKKKGHPRAATPPPDNPQLRHEELSIDRLVSAAGGTTPEAARGIVEASAKPKKKTRGAEAAAAGGNGEVKETATLRLSALTDARGLPRPDAAGPRGATTGVEEIAAVSGISNWVQLGPTAIPNGQTYSAARVLVTGRVTAIVIDPTNTQTLYLGSAQGGVWKTTDGGKNWAPLTDNAISLAIGALAMDPSDPHTLYAGTGEGNFSGDSYYGNGVLKTTNSGASWTALATSTFVGTRFGRIAITPGTTSRLFAATGNGIYRSTDSGNNWTLMSSGLPAGSATDVAIDSGTPTTVFAAFWGQGIYRTTNAGAATPTWTKLTSGLPTTGFTRIALATSPSAGQIVYALMAGPGSSNYPVNRFLRSSDGGNTWTAIPLPGGNLGIQGFYNLNVTVDPTTPDIVYLSAISVWKATRNPTTNTWTITEIGSTIHPDNHSFAVDPVNHLVLYAGNDGGIYKSTNGGGSWSDAINEGPCITQFEFMAQHPTSDAVVFCGTQDNGTEQFRNSPVFYHADDGDGGFTAIDSTQPRNVISTYYGPSPKRSTQAGKFGTWSDVSPGLAGGGLFYPPLALDDTNPNNIAFGTDRINLDSAQGTGGWPTKVTLPGITGAVSAIHYVNSNLIYAATTLGQVFRLDRSGTTWSARAIHAAPLPGNWIWDVIARPDNNNIVIVVESGFGISHVWRGTVPATGVATWANVSGTGTGTLPDIPVNALAIEPGAPDTWYIGTDVAVFRTTNAGTTWTQFSQGLPNCAVFDMKLHAAARLLRVATHGRGMWERRLDVPSQPDVHLFLRDNLMDTGRASPSPSPVAAAFEDPLQFVNLGDTLYWYMCADMKVDALEGSPPAYQIAVADVDYAAFESRLAHRNPQRGRVNRVYVQVHNRGITTGAGVTVKLLYANASAGLPPLPPDFWSAFPGNSTDTSNWKPIGTAKVIGSLSPTEPTVLEWDWSTPLDAADHSCILAIVDCPSDPIPAASKVFDVNHLVPNERRVGLKNLHVVNALPGTFYWTPFQFFARGEAHATIRITGPTAGKWRVGLVFPKGASVPGELHGVERSKATAQHVKALKTRLGEGAARFDTTRLYLAKDMRVGGTLGKVKLPAKGLQAMLLLIPPATATTPGTINIVQEQGNVLLGGSTFVLRTARR